ncbi:MAG: zinc-ribbon and DUF3426 domain-containing protein [Gammaproteobacteria bacterium]|nr:zinc-ribbon and DUF3426 domain-containing protein [Gammaproteobacteria bacterium]
MFTVCPKCALTLAVAAADLRVGQGYVRCGRCSNVFNALLTLSEDAVRPAPAAGSGSVSRSMPAPPPPAEALSAFQTPSADDLPPAESAPELTEHDVTFVVRTAASAPAADGSETHDYRDTGTFETIVLEGDAVTQTEEQVPKEAVETQIAQIAQQIAAHGDGGLRPAQVPPAAGDFGPAEPAPSRRLAWGLGAGALLLLLLGAQAVHHWRGDLATQPALNAPLIRLYAALGQPLAPRWNLTEYEVNQLGAQSDPSADAAINVRLSVMNHAEHAQPVPLVRLTLLDRYGKRLAARDLTPREYLKNVPANGFLASGQRLDAQVAVQDPGPEASSFELDVCLPGPAGALRCAGDQPATAARR